MTLKMKMKKENYYTLQKMVKKYMKDNTEMDGLFTATPFNNNFKKKDTLGKSTGWIGLRPLS